MSARHDIPDSVLQEQHKASNPAWSAWASANAGSGKTHVLTQRVIKLLLDGEDPAKILCITFTKAAAATMATRVFDTLAGWTALDDKGLDRAIASTGLAPSAALRLRARRLFALALETPGGLKVQTIHAFCTRLLHLFPFEAEVGAGFEVLDDAAQSQLLERLAMEVLLEGAARPDTALGRALAAAIDTAADQTFRDLIREAVGRRDAIAQWIARTGSLEAALDELSETLDIAPDESAAAIEDRILTQSCIGPAEWADIAAHLSAGKKSDQEQAEKFRRLGALAPRERLDAYLSVFCTDKLQPRKSLVTGTIRKEHPALAQRLEDEQTRICALLEKRHAAQCHDRTRALLAVAHAVIARYTAEKSRRGQLDYDDLIARTLALFQRTSAKWVLYKLDLGINHLLLDEAQDTNPQQWEIIATLVSEFTAGAGARDIKRTMFVVGDDKQSIFSFQGAAPEKFGAMHNAFERSFTAAAMQWRNVRLQTSFRSGDIVLGAVDAVFAREIAFRGLSSDPVPTVHQALPSALPGSVEIWPLVKPDTRNEIEGWDAPFDEASETSPPVRLARRIAWHARHWQARGTRPRDILILVRQRGPLFEAIIRALKDAGLPVAGADRMTLIEHIAVMDLIALADALLLPEDDLALACALKSPLFGFDEDALFRIAYGRGALSLRAAFASAHTETAARLDALGEAALRQPPFSFFAQLLGPGGGRARFLARLGPEANDALDEFLNLALAYEQRETPSLQGFVAWLRNARAEVKRDMDIARDEVRVMTVHGAKGLEAPVVILAETTAKPEGHHPPRLLDLPLAGGDGLVWATSKDSDPPKVAEARAAARRAEADEYRRLLYVAMTRAERRLVVCGAATGKIKKDGEASIPEDCWYRLIEGALVQADDANVVETPAEDGDGIVWRWRKAEPVYAASGKDVCPTVPRERPAWLGQRLAPDPKRARAFTPSHGDDIHLPRKAGAIAREQALRRGRVVHRLIQSLPDLPAASRMEAAHDYLRRNAQGLPDAESIARKLIAILDDAQFAALFARGSRAEVALAGTIARAGLPPLAVTGQVDRLAVTQSAVLIADYKTDRPPPTSLAQVPRAYRRQLALYRALLSRIYPGRTVQAALVFTEIPALMPIPAEMMDAELASLTCP
jgi:ATP-dependent helicase/nuclease subunit A